MKAPIYVYASLVLGAGTLLLTADPAPPLLVSPASNAINVSTSPTLQVKVSEPGNGVLTVRFYGRLARNPGPDFTVAALPDTQYYSSSMNGGLPAIFAAQTDWIVANRAASNIAYVAHLGDIVNYGDTNRGVEELAAWQNATNALYRLENPVTTGLPSGIPYGAAVGNHDQSPNGNPDGTTRYYNQFFGVPHFTGRSYYGGHYGSNNDNHFDLFSASGLDFIAVYLEFDVDANPLVLNWANNLLRTHSNRRAMVVSHYIGRSTTPSTLGPQGAATYNALRTNANLFLMLCGHVDGEGSRVDVFNGNSVCHPGGRLSVLSQRRQRLDAADAVLPEQRRDPGQHLFALAEPIHHRRRQPVHDPLFHVAGGGGAGHELHHAGHQPQRVFRQHQQLSVARVAAQSSLRVVCYSYGCLEPYRDRPPLAIHHLAANGPARRFRRPA